MHCTVARLDYLYSRAQYHKGMMDLHHGGSMKYSISKLLIRNAMQGAVLSLLLWTGNCTGPKIFNLLSPSFDL
jgi:hypothetical protein